MSEEVNASRGDGDQRSGGGVSEPITCISPRLEVRSLARFRFTSSSHDPS